MADSEARNSEATEGTTHRPLKVRTDGSHSRVRELGSIGVFSIFLQNFVKSGPFVTKVCIQVTTYHRSLSGLWYQYRAS